MEKHKNLIVKPTGKVDKNIAGLYDFERTLGSGHFAVVKLARHVFTGEKVAVKVIDKTKLDEISKAHLYQEVRCMKLVQHPNVVRLYEVVDTPTKLYLILEYGDGGDMYDHIMKHEGKGISEEKAKHYFRQIVSAIDYCHKLHVVHRDLKPENVIFFKSHDVAKLTDFGFSNSFSPGEKLSTSCGSLAYSAPEILLGDSYEPPAVDVWSLGVILYMMVCGTGPFSHINDSETLTKIMDCKYYVPEHLSTECKRLISRMLVREPSKRATLDSIYHDPWMSHVVTEEETEGTAQEPLISDIRVTPDLHLMILQRMESGDIAHRDEIQTSLEADNYDHITATYFLIAERLLRKRYGATAFHLKLEERRSYPYEEIRSQSDPNLLDVDEEANGSSSPELRSRSNSIKKMQASTSRRGSLPRSVDDMADIVVNDSDINEDNVAYTTEFAPRSLNITPRSHRMTYPNSLMKPTLSSPNLLLNEISEENESDFEDSPRNSPIGSRRSLRRQHKYNKKRTGCRLSPIHSRRSSCSSSDDEDLQKLDRRLNIQVALQTTGRVLPHLPESSGGDKEHGSEQDNCNNGKKNCLTLFEDDKENLINFANIPYKIYVTSLNGRVRNLSDTDLVLYQARYGFTICKNTKCRSDTNLASSSVGKKSRNQFVSCTTVNSPKPIEEENPADISPLSSPIVEDKGNHFTKVTTVIQDDEFSSIQEADETSNSTRTGSSLLTQSRSNSKSSLKYIYNDPLSSDPSNFCTIEENTRCDDLSSKNLTTTTTIEAKQNSIHSYSVSKMGHALIGQPVESKCCCIL
eukprot:gene18867-20767_t